VSTPEDEEPIASAVQLTHLGGPSLGSEPLIEADEVAAVLGSREAGGAAMRGGALRVAGYIVNAAMGALSAAFMFRHLGTAVGTYVTALAIAAVVAGLSDLGLTALGLRELSVRDAPGRAALMRNLLGLRMALTLLGIAGSVSFAVAVGYDSVLVAGVALAGAGLMLQNIQATLAVSLMARLKLGLVTATEVGSQVLNAALTIALVLVGAGVLYFIGIAIPLGIIFVAITAWLVRHEVPLVPRFDRAEWRTLAREVLPYSAAVALAVIYFRLSVIVVSLTASAVQLSYFGASFRILEVLIIIPGLMVTGVFPIFARSARDDQERFAYAVSRVFAVALIVGLWFTIAVAIGAPFAIRVIGGPAFAPAAGVLQIQAFGLGGSFISAVWGMTLLSLRRNRQLVMVNLAGLVLGTILVIALTSAYGAEGAAAGTAITEVLLAASVPLVLLRTDRHVVPAMGVVPRVLLAAAIAGTVALIPGLPAVAGAILASLVYFAALMVMKAVPEEIFVEVRKVAGSLRGRPAGA
jgi:O-antigen/teichoic acid export membrane protein